MMKWWDSRKWKQGLIAAGVLELLWRTRGGEGVGVIGRQNVVADGGWDICRHVDDNDFLAFRILLLLLLLLPSASHPSRCSFLLSVQFVHLTQFLILVFEAIEAWVMCRFVARTFVVAYLLTVHRFGRHLDGLVEEVCVACYESLVALSLLPSSNGGN